MAKIVPRRLHDEWEEIKRHDDIAPKAELWVPGDIFRQYRAASGAELVARSADAAAGSGTNERGV